MGGVREGSASWVVDQIGGEYGGIAGLHSIDVKIAAKRFPEGGLSQREDMPTVRTHRQKICESRIPIRRTSFFLFLKYLSLSSDAQVRARQRDPGSSSCQRISEISSDDDSTASMRLAASNCKFFCCP